MSPKMVPAQPWAAPHGYLYFPYSEIDNVSTDQLHLDIWYRPCALQAGAVGASGLRVAGGGTQAGLGSRQAGCPFLRDHDDDVSLVEACRKLNEVIGLKGMGRYSRWDPCALPVVPRDHTCDAHPAVLRYFKQIVKSARANGKAGPTEDHTDDFLGCLNIPIGVSGCGGFTHGTPACGCRGSWGTASGCVL